MQSNFSWGPLPHFPLDNAPRFVFVVGRIRANGTVASLGTAFSLDKPGYFATSAHVVGFTDNRLKIVQNSIKTLNEYQVPEPGNLMCHDVEIVAHDPIHDIAVLYSKKFLGAWNVVIGSVDSISVGSDAILIGFPHLDVDRNVLTRFHATVGAKLYLPSPAGNVKALTLNALTRPGQSGSPIFHERSNEIVAILTGSYKPSVGGTFLIGNMDATSLHQTTHAVSAEYLKGMY